MFIFELDSVECPDFEYAIIFLIPCTVFILEESKVRFRVQNLLEKNSRRRTS